MPPDPPPIGPLLRRLRLSAALSQEELAERSGLSVRGIGDIERGVHRAPRLETVRLLADALQLGEQPRAELLAAARPEFAVPVAVHFDRASPRATLPSPLTRMIGRDEQIATLARLLTQGDHRLVTLTGPGGVGKTRLALVAARAVAERFADGAVFVDLAPVRDPVLVATAVAAALGTREAGSSAAADLLAAYLGGREMVLVLDNFEQVLDAAPLVSDLLAIAPGLRVLATSREPLRLSGERVVPVEPLVLPAAEPFISENDRLPEAVALFVDRAHAADPGFALTVDNAAAVRGVVRRLDGLPLAIELAAARVRTLPPAALSLWLEQGALRLLTGGPRDHPDRQRTIRDAIRWSYDLLTLAEQRLFRTLSVFVGGFTLEAAAVVAAEPGAGDLEILDGVSSLMEKSLAQRANAAEGAPRYFLLETIREFGLEQLAASGEEAAVRGAHMAWLLDLAEQSDVEILGRKQGLWLQRLEDEHPNLRAALTWLETRGDAATRLRIASALTLFWFIRGHLSEGRAWLERAIADGEDAPATLRARALRAASTLAFGQADYHAAMALAEACLAVAETIADTRNIAAAQFALGMVLEMQGQYTLAVPRLEAALALWRQVDDQIWVGVSLAQLGETYAGLRDLDRAVKLAEESLNILREIGGPWTLAVTLSNLGFVCFQRGDPARAEFLFRESLARWWEVDDQWFIAHALAQLAMIAADQQDFKRSARLIGTVEAVCLTLAVHLTFSPAVAAPYERALHVTRVQLGEEAFAAACAAGRSLPLAGAVSEAMTMAPHAPGDPGGRVSPSPANGEE